MHPLGTERRVRATYACAHARDIYHSIPTNCLKRECDNQTMPSIQRTPNTGRTCSPGPTLQNSGKPYSLDGWTTTGARNWHAARRRCDHLPTSARQRPLNNTETRHASFFSGDASFQQTLRKREANPSTHTNNYWCSLTQTPEVDEQGHDMEAQESGRCST